MQYIKRIVTTLAVFFVIDLVWLGYLAQPIYQKYLGDLLRDDFLAVPALIFYILFTIGLVYFAIDPALKQKSRELAVRNSAMFGFMTYMTYELTSYAVIESWAIQIVFIDIIWGVVLSSGTGLVSYHLLNKK